MKPKHPGRWIAGSLFLLAAAAIAAPYFGADGFAATIKQELERTLRRKVEINGQSHFRLLPRPGFSVADVVIHEDPKIGIEQFAYVPLLHVDVSASSIWKWRIEFASLRLDSPSINLMKAADGRWNVQSLADRARREAVGSLPGIEVSEGRLNFKSRDLKSVYYLAEADLSVEASGSQQLSLRFSGVPARTDRPAHGFGRLSGRGSVSVPERGAGRLELNLALERTAAAEILTLLQGRGAGLGGFVRSQARLVGGWSNIEISGRMELDDFERWGWLFPGNSGWGMDYKGALDLENQTLEVETRAPERVAAALPLSVRLRATRLSADTSWGALITLRGVPLDSLRSLAEEIGTEIPAGLPLQGTLTGALGYSPAGGFRGKVAVAEASVTLPDLPPLRLEDLTVVADGSQMSLGPATVRVGEAHSAVLEARFQPGSPAMDVHLVSSGIELAHLQAGWRRFTGSDLPPLLAVARGGIVKGLLRFERTAGDHPPVWSGDLQLSDAVMNVAGLAQPVRLGKAALRIRGADTSLWISAGSIPSGIGTSEPISFIATYVRPAAERRPHQLRIEIPSLAAADLERALAPALRRDQGFLARTLRLGATPVPEWLRVRNVVATVRVGAFQLGDYQLDNVRARMVWEGARVDFREVLASVESSPLSGSLIASLAGPTPVWHGNFQLQDYPWRDGRIDAEAAIESDGLGEQFLAALRMDGSFSAENLAIAPDTTWRAASGCFEFQAAGSPRLQLSGLHALIGSENFLGQSVAGPDGRLTIELASTLRTLRWPVRMSGLSMDLPASR